MSAIDELDDLVASSRPPSVADNKAAKMRKVAIQWATEGRRIASRNSIANRAQFGDPPLRPVSLARVAWLDRPDP